MHGGTSLDWPTIRTKAAAFSDDAFEFVRDGLRHTAETIHGLSDPDSQESNRHVSGQQLCLGMRDLAIQRYGMLARTVLHRWGIHSTDDFGTIVYAMIDRGELRAGPRDSYDDFKGVFDFAESFASAGIGSSK